MTYTVPSFETTLRKCIEEDYRPYAAELDQTLKLVGRFPSSYTKQRLEADLKMTRKGIWLMTADAYVGLAEEQV